MSFISENVIPGNHGKVFGTNAEAHESLVKIQSAIEKIEGVKDVIITEDVFPKEIVVHTISAVAVKDIQDVVISVGYHVIPKSMFAL